MWKKILYTNKVKCYSVSYEDFVSKTEKHLRHIFDLSHIKKQKINLLSSVNIVEDKRKNILYENYKNQKKIDFIKHKYYLLCDTISDFFSYYFNILLRKANLKNDVLFRQLIQNSIDYYMSASISLSIVKIKTSHINKTKPVVLCLVKNGERYIDTFIEHYKNLGFEQMVFLDNNSSDKTLEMLHKYSLDNKISIYSSKLKYKKYGLYFKKYLQNKFGKENWNLLVDIDELWIPPLEFKNNLSKFISDIEKDNSTSVPGIMIDIYYNKNYFTSIKKKRPTYVFLRIKCYEHRFFTVK